MIPRPLTSRFPVFAALAVAAVALAWPSTVEAAPRYESGVLTNSQPTASTWRTVTFSTTFTAPPVVVASPPTYGDTQGITVRVRNVTATGFEYQLDEWDYLDGVHASESLNYLALEPGVHQIGGLQWQAGRVSGVTRTAQAATLASGFSAAPVVIAQVETTNNASAVVSRVQSVTTTGFNIKLQTQEATTSTLTGESVSFVAISPGTGTIGGAPFLVGRTGANITQNWSTLSFGGTYRQPLFFAQTQTNNGGDPFAIRRRNLGNTSVELFLQEEQSNDAEVNHTAEDTGYLVLGESVGEIRAKLEVGSFQQAQTGPNAWTTVTFDQSYTNPVVVFGPAAEGDAEPVRVRVRNVTSTGFEFQLDEWDYQDGVHPADKVSYLVAEEGSYVIGGVRWQFGRATGVTNQAAVRTFAESFSTTPVVLAQVATRNEAAAVNDRISNVTTTGFTLQLEEEKAADQTHAAETVHYVAIEPGNGRLVTNTLVFEAANSAANVNHNFRQLTFGRKVADPFVIADGQTRNGADPIVTRYRELYAGGVQVRVQEDASVDTNVTHGNESIGYLAFASAVDLDGDGLPDSWELAHGLNPNDPTDAALDPDNDGLNNLNEYRYGTNLNGFDTGGTATVEATTPDAYELEGTAARFRINRTGANVPVTVFYTLGGRATLPGQSGADYTVTDAAGNPLTGSITLGYGETSAEIVITPIADSLNEYPETAVLTLSSNARYTVGATSSAAVNINDAAPTAANEQLFVAFLTRQGTAQTYASGIATLYLNGPKNIARVNLSFSGLTSNQTNAYIRYGVTSGVGPELRPTLPIGQVVDQPWNIIPAGIYNGQDIIDALFQVGGKYVYLNIGTGNYPAGEIAGTVSRQTGSTTFTPPADPPTIPTLTGDALTRDVARFLTQATFGPTKADIDALVTQVTTTYSGNRIAAYNAWINSQFALDQTKLLDYTQAADADEWTRRGSDPINFTNNDEPNYHNRRRGWWLLSTKAHDQLRQRVAFALSEILVVSDDLTVLRNKHYGLANYYDQLATRANGNYRTLLEDVSKSPIMAKWLSHLQNQKAVVDSGTGQVLISPDENYAREILQLFSVGLVNRHLDGTLKLGSNGQPIQTYTNADITELARVFTGWSFSKKNGAKADGYPEQDNTNFLLGNGPAYFQASWTNPLKNFAAYHDTAAKTVLGSNIAAGLNGQQDLTAALDIIFTHPNVAPFISRLLIQRLVTSNPSTGYVYRVAKTFEDNGSGVRGDLKSVVKAILLDYEARNLDLIGNIGYGKQKEPIIRYIQLLRAVGGQSALPLSTLSASGYPSTQLDNFPSGTTLYRYGVTDAALSQTPQSAPTVFNWFLPDFTPGGAISAAGLVAPELEISTETSVVTAVNYEYQLTHIDGGQNTAPLVGATDGTLDNVRLDRTPLEQIYDTAVGGGQTVAQATTTLLDHLDVLLLSGNLKAKFATVATPNPRSIIVDTVAGQTLATAARVKELLYLVVTSPEYVNQK